jgi:hypothetical protein
MTQNYAYDLQEWDVRFTLESTYSTGTNRRGSDDFVLKLRDICWDIPTTAAVMTKSEYELYLWHQDDSNVVRDLPTMATGVEISWTNKKYCGGYTYDLVLIGTEANAPIVTATNVGTGLTWTTAEL